jgi:hypothetical protein
MKGKRVVIGLFTLLVLLGLVLVSKQGKRPIPQGSKNQLVITPEGTIEVPRNDNMTIIAEFSRTTNSVVPRKK